MSAPLRLVFLGSDSIALPLLQGLETEKGTAEVIAVFTQPDRAVGRGQKIQPNAIKAWALARGLPVFQPEKLDDDVRQQLGALRADLGLVMAYGHILRDEFIGTPRLGMLNFHTSLLPKYRGASPIQTAVANGERVTGVTLMRIVKKLDAGPIVDWEQVIVDSLDTAGDIETKLAAACGPLLARALPGIAAGTARFLAQDESAATYCRKLEKEDGMLDFASPATTLAARINGLFPWPSCSIEIGGQSIRLGLADAMAAAGISAPAGCVAGVDAHGLLVATGAGLLRLRRLQRAGGKMLSASEFLRGFPVAIGTPIPSRPMPPLVVVR
ncbi:MAG: methionyl-tRNA formyltransferase [Opitutaceae bacterium]